MVLRDLFLTDLDTIINTDEFAVPKVVNGTSMPVVWATDMFKDLISEKTQLMDPAGIYLDTVVMEVKVSDYGVKPAVGEDITVDGDTYSLLNVNLWEGLYQLTLEVHNS